MKNNKNRIDRIATRIVCGNENDDAKLMSHDEIVEFLYSQVKRVEINVTLPDTSDFSVEDGRTGAKKYPQHDKTKRNKKFFEQVEKDQNEIQAINEQWERLEKTIDSLPAGNNGNSFYGNLAVKVLKNRAFSIRLKRRHDPYNERKISNDPYDESNKNNPFLYEGIDSINDFRDFLVRKFESNEMVFNKCITESYDVDDNIKMPLDVYTTIASLKTTSEEVEVYIKFGIYNKGTEMKIELEFENFSFHPSKNKINH